ncbi:MAG: glutamate decarboxylase, partial [Halobacteriota archaeon]
LVAVRLKDAPFTVFQLSDKLRQNGWIVPAYYLPENAHDVAVLRMVIKENFSRDMVELLCTDVVEAYHSLELSETELEGRAKSKENLSLLY